MENLYGRKDGNNHLLRLLSLLDRNPLSPYYGCFDRDFWHYRMARDFSCATFQAGVLPLALWYATDLRPDLKGNPKLLEYIKAGINFWVKSQRKDGSFDEWFPNEHSIVATSFSLWAITEALLNLKPHERRDIIERCFFAFKKASKFLEYNVDSIALNHTAGSLAALYNLYLLTEDESFLQSFHKNKTKMLTLQDEEGWYHEYGEPDGGYQSLSVFYLASYWKRSGDDEILASLAKAVSFMRWLVHPDGSYAGEYLSRNTRYCFRYGLHLLAKKLPDAADILSWLSPDKIVDIESADDRYFTLFFLPEYLLCQTMKDEIPHTIVPALGIRRFQNAGVVVVSTPRLHMVVNLRKGGACKVYDRSSRLPVASLLGYMYSDKRGIKSTLGFAGSEADVYLTKDYINIRIQAKFLHMKSRNPLSVFLIPLRIYNHLVGKLASVNKIFDNFLKLFLVKRNRRARGLLIRHIVLKDNELKICDKLVDVAPNCTIYQLRTETFRFVPSSKYALIADINSFQSGQEPYSTESMVNLHWICG